MSDAARRGLPLLSGPPPSQSDSSSSDGSCRKCNKEFNVLFSRSRKCNHCGYLYCHSCSDYQALMPRSGGGQSGYDPMHVCGFCIEYLNITASGKAQLKAMPLSKLKKYVTAYNVKIDRAVEKDDLIDGIFAAKGPNGCLSKENENFYRKYSVPNRATSTRSRGLFSRPGQSTSNNANSNATPPTRPTPPSNQEFARPDLAPDDPPAHSHSQPQGSSWRTSTGPPPPPPPRFQPNGQQPPPPPHSGYGWGGGGGYGYHTPPPNPHAQSRPYSQTGPGYSSYPGASSNYSTNYNSGYNPTYAQYTPHGAYPPPPHPPPPQDHYYAGQSAQPPPPPPPRETRPPPPPPNPNTYPNRQTAPSSSTNSNTSSSAPRARTTSAAPPPVPTLDELLEMTSDAIRALSIGTLKSVLFANHVAAGQILEKSDLVNKVIVLVEDEQRERARAREAEEMERMAREVEREERERERREADERVQREREEYERSREEAREATGSSTATASDAAQQDGAGGPSRPTSPPDPPPKTEEKPRPTSSASPRSHAAAHLERTGLCVICQDEEANIAIVDCGHLAMCRACSELVMSSSRECPLCRTRIVTEARLLRIFKT